MDFLNDITLILHQIGRTSANITSPHDRMNIIAWMNKIRLDSSIFCSERSLEVLFDYAQYLKGMLILDPVTFSMPFDMAPPYGVLQPLPECLGNIILENFQHLSRIGPIRPILCNQSEDGKTTIRVEKTDQGGLFCYMSALSKAKKS